MRVSCCCACAMLQRDALLLQLLTSSWRCLPSRRCRLRWCGCAHDAHALRGILLNKMFRCADMVRADCERFCWAYRLASHGPCALGARFEQLLPALQHSKRRDAACLRCYRGREEREGGACHVHAVEAGGSCRSRRALFYRVAQRRCARPLNDLGVERFDALSSRSNYKMQRKTASLFKI